METMSEEEMKRILAGLCSEPCVGCTRDRRLIFTYATAQAMREKAEFAEKHWAGTLVEEHRTCKGPCNWTDANWRSSVLARIGWPKDAKEK